ncbi:hypothetical protein IFJ82_00845 [Novacetimonas hansenii]|uniref:hypothetical protein n=1 Tax=Novacetimonas hansenii TaxID=436 RepID=UPI001780CB31|nr:hypothetical protein [Novacetimonas hansenii]MBL7237892.1 hypothetical protein [Novacetimonas hansenii]QOF95309.1 hypothetical protein IFJ82_00845 [Novacetimonas hansenii]
MTRSRRNETGELPLPHPPAAPRDNGSVPAPKKRTPRPPAPPPAGQEDLFARPLPPVPVPPRRVTHLDATEIGLSPVPLRHFGPADATDGFFYIVTTSSQADAMLAHGLSISPRTPVSLTERPGVMAWYVDMSEDMEAISDEGGVAILRLRRFMVNDLVENDPDHTRAYGVPCYFLTGVTRAAPI